MAQNATARFTGLVVNGRPGETVTLTFRTQVCMGCDDPALWISSKLQSCQNFLLKACSVPQPCRCQFASFATHCVTMPADISIHAESLQTQQTSTFTHALTRSHAGRHILLSPSNTVPSKLNLALLTFVSQNGLNLSRQVILRHCVPGEFTDNSTSTSIEASYTCRRCPSPQFSFYPTAPTCSQCAMLPLGSYDVCNMAALVPADGWYQSHPRIPVVGVCSEAQA